jgi:hypothetical protein
VTFSTDLRPQPDGPRPDGVRLLVAAVDQSGNGAFGFATWGTAAPGGVSVEALSEGAHAPAHPHWRIYAWAELPELPALP